MMTPAELNSGVETLVSIVWKQGGAMSNVAFFTSAMEALEGNEDRVRPFLREAISRKRLNINRAWQVVIPE